MKQLKIKFGPELFNDSFFPVYEDKNRILLLVGGANSGKSVATAQKYIIRTLEEYNNRWLLIRKVHRSIKQSQYAELKRWIRAYNLNYLFEFRDTEPSIRCEKTNTEFLTAGLDDVEKLKSIVDISSTWIEEATELTASDFQQVNLRMRGETNYYKQHVLCLNPINEYHWIKKDLIDNKIRQNISVHYSTYLDNKFATSEDRQEIEVLRDLDPILWQIYGEGIWGTIKELIFINWTEVNEFPQNCEIIYGLDFGYFNPTALIKVGRIGRELYLEQEIYQSHITNNDLIDIMKELKITTPIYPDDAEPNRIEELRRAGFNCKAVNKKVQDGISYVRGWHLNIVKSPDILKEIKGYKNKIDRLTGQVTDEPVKFNDHAMSAIRYAIYTHGSNYWLAGGLSLPDFKIEKQKRFTDNY